jgi:chemotaxis regulatin CheY-phosphate phosphatase CheZ
MNANQTLAMAQVGYEQQSQLAAQARALAQCWRGDGLLDDGDDEDLIAQTHMFLDDVVQQAERTAHCLALIMQAQTANK